MSSHLACVTNFSALADAPLLKAEAELLHEPGMLEVGCCCAHVAHRAFVGWYPYLKGGSCPFSHLSDQFEHSFG